MTSYHYNRPYTVDNGDLRIPNVVVLRRYADDEQAARAARALIEESMLAAGIEIHSPADRADFEAAAARRSTALAIPFA